jgi:anti-sigma-K factor RskA
MEIVQAPGTIQVSLTGTAAAPSAIGRAAFNPGRGMVVSAERLPALRPGREYQLWMIVQGQALSAGLFTVSADGAVTFVATLPTNLLLSSTAAVTIGVTEEPEGGSPGPNLPILLAGVMTRR